MALFGFCNLEFLLNKMNQSNPSNLAKFKIKIGKTQLIS